MINGAKAFITNSGTAITSVVTVTADRHRATAAEISAILVPTGTPGFTVEPAYDKLGWHASDTHGADASTTAGCPAANLLGEPRQRASHSSSPILDDGRIAIAALARRAAPRPAWTCPCATRNERHAFGAPIGREQGVAFQLADLAVAVEAARLLTYKAAALKDAGRRRRPRSSRPRRSPSCTPPRRR